MLKAMKGHSIKENKIIKPKQDFEIVLKTAIYFLRSMTLGFKVAFQIGRVSHKYFRKLFSCSERLIVVDIASGRGGHRSSPTQSEKKAF